MKKLLVMIIAIAGLSSIASATIVKWGLSSALDTDTYANGSTVYLVQGTFSAPATAPATWTESNLGTVYARGSLTDGIYKDTTGVDLNTTDTGFNGNTPFYVAVISADGKNLAATSSSNINIKDSPMGASFNKGAAGFTTYPAAIPEPTAIALISLGLAALGMKRKVA